MKRAIMKSSARRKVRYAVVGLGHLAQVAVLPGFAHAKNSELVALVSGDPKKLVENRMPQDRRGTLSLSAGDSALSEEQVRATLASADCKVISSARTYAERAQLSTLRFEVQWKSRANDSATPRFVEQLAHQTGIASLSWQP